MYGFYPGDFLNQKLRIFHHISNSLFHQYNTLCDKDSTLLKKFVLLILGKSVLIFLEVQPAVKD